MAERIVPDSRLGRDRLRPAAQPQDTFVKPARPTNLLSLAESLGQFAPAVAGVASALAERKAEKDAEQGAADASLASQKGKSFRQAIADGDINPAGSGQYKKAAKKQFAQLSAFTYGAALNTFMTEQLADETDLGEFNRKVDEFTQKWVGENTDPQDGEFAKDFSRQAAAIRQNAVQQLSWRVGERKRAETEEQFGTLVGAAVMGEFNWTAPEGREARVISAVSALRQQAFDMGIRGSRVNQLIFESVSNIGIADGKPELINALADVPTGPNGSVKMVDIPEYREKIARAYHAAEAAANRRDTTADNTKKEQANQVLAAMQNELITAQENGLDPASVNITAFKRQMNDLMPEKVSELESARQAFLQGFKRQTLPVIESDLVEKVYDPDRHYGLDDLRQDFERGGMSTDTYLKWRRQIQSRDRVRTTHKAIRPDQLLSEALRVIGEKVDASGLLGDDARIFKGRLRTQLRSQAYEWLATEDGTKANAEAIRSHFRIIAETLTDNIGKRKRTP